MRQDENTTHEPTTLSRNFGSNQPLVSDPSLLDYLLICAKYKKMIFRTTFGVAVMTAIITLCMPNIYTAKTMIVPTDDDKGMMGAMMGQLSGLAGIAGGAFGTTTKTDLYITMLKSESVKDPIIDRFNLMKVYKAKFRQDVYKSLDGIVLISTGKKDGVITINVDDKDPKRAAAIANAYVEELGKLAAKLTMSGAGQNRAFLEGRLASAKVDLSKAEEAMKDFQARNKALDVPEQAKAAIEGVAQLRAQLALQEAQLATLQRQFTDSSHEVKSTRATIANLRSQIGRLEGSGGNSSIPSIGSVPKLGQEYLRLMRQFKIHETLVELLTKQFEIAKLNESKDMSPFQVLQKARTPEKKSKPKRGITVILNSILACFISIIIAFIRNSSGSMSSEDQERWRNLMAGLRLRRRKKTP